MAKKNKDLCARGSKLRDDTERGIAATALDAADKQIQLHRKAMAAAKAANPQMGAESDES